ncbi:membrane or secreted protein [Crateriforma spongiae]|uniref:membrane or secreted protein n=1 Tax=Crateriforma spongiae TaxID=2724528 RepID=UPI0039AF8F5D
MSLLSFFAIRRIGHPRSVCRLILSACLVLCVVATGEAQNNAAAPDAVESYGDVSVAEAGDDGEAGFASAIDLLPSTTAGLVRFPSLPDFCASGGETNFGRLLDDPSMKPFREAQRELANKYLDSLDQKIGLKVEDVYDIASGEVVAAWLPYPKEPRRPYAFCVIADIRGRSAAADEVLQQVDADMKVREAQRKDLEHAGETIRVYMPKTKVGQYKIEQIAIWKSEDRVIASDRDTLVTELIDAIQGRAPSDTIGDAELYSTIRSRSEAAIKDDVQRLGDDVPGVPMGVQWYAEPFAMGEIAREAFHVDRRGNVQILELLQNQGFDAIQAAGGTVAIGTGDFDWLHRGVVIAPPTAEDDQRYQLGARILQFPNRPRPEIPDWVGGDTANFMRLSWKVGDAFLALETLVDEAMGSEVFMDTLEDIRRGEDTANVDILNDVVPNLGEEMILLTDNVLPASISSERMLVALELKDAAVIKDSLRRIMQNEPNFTLLESIPDLEVWKYEVTDDDESFEDELFGDFGDFQDVAPAEEEEQQLLTTWAIAVVPATRQGQADYVVFSSHSDLLIETAKRMRKPPADGLNANTRVQKAVAAMQSLGAEDVAVDRIVRTDLSRRIKYELLRQGELRNSDSVLASLIKRIVDESELQDEPDPIEAKKLPPFKTIQKYFGVAGNFVITTDDGWALCGFVLKQ